MADKHYKGNPNLKAENVQVEFTEEQISEYLKCKADPVYFALKYIRCLLYTSPSPRDYAASRMPSSA